MCTNNPFGATFWISMGLSLKSAFILIAVPYFAWVAWVYAKLIFVICINGLALH